MSKHPTHSRFLAAIGLLLVLSLPRLVSAQSDSEPEALTTEIDGRARFANTQSLTDAPRLTDTTSGLQIQLVDTRDASPIVPVHFDLAQNRKVSVEVLLAITRLRLFYSPFRWLVTAYGKWVAPLIHSRGPSVTPR